MIQKDDVLPRANEPPFLSALHAKNDTTNPFGYKRGESTENNKALLFFSVRKQFKLLAVPFKPYADVCEVNLPRLNMFEHSAKI